MHFILHNMDNVPNNMSPSVETITIPSFPDYLNNNADTYKDCDVICVTHAKNLNSAFLHEYLHVIIRDPGRTRWRRLLAERQNEQDQVIIGLWPWQQFGLRSRGSSSSSSSSSSGDDAILPLLLRNITVQSGLPLRELAQVLVQVNKEAPKYNVFTHNCFWYANSVYKLLQMHGQPHSWPWVEYMAIPAVLNSSVRDGMKKAAEEFKKEMVHSPFRGTRGVNKSDAEPSTAAAVEGEDDDDYAEAIEDLGNADHEENTATFETLQSLDLINNIDEAATRTAIEARKADLTAFADHVLASPDREENLKAYREALSQRQTQVEKMQATSSPEVDDFVTKLQAAVEPLAGIAPSKAEEARFEEAINTFVGGVLRRLSEADASE